MIKLLNLKGNRKITEFLNDKESIESITLEQKEDFGLLFLTRKKAYIKKILSKEKVFYILGSKSI